MDLSALSSVTTTATSLSNLVLVSPKGTVGYQAQNPPTLGGLLNNLLSSPPNSFVFHYEGEQTVGLESDITDHYVENNTPVEDHIALKPEIITTHGFIGELNNVPPPFLAILQAAADKLQGISAYAPGLSTTAQLAYANAFQLYQVANNAINTAVSAWTSLTGQAGATVIDGTTITPAANQNKQQAAFQQFYGYWSKRTLFTIQTPWAVFQNCAILKLRAIQSEETRMISDFEISFKLIRMASTESGSGKTSAGRRDFSSQPETNLGTSTPAGGVSQTAALGGL